MIKMSSLPLNLKESMALKGFAITLVMIHHFEQSPIAFESLLFFKACGAIACSIFFFVSGYGLVISSKNKTLSYWSARFLKVSLPFFFANIIYVIAYRQPFFSFADYVLYIMGVKLINPHCWFIHALLCMYIAYAVGEALKWKLGGVIIPLIAGVSYSLLTRSVGSISWLAFPCGVAIAHITKKGVVSLWYTRRNMRIIMNNAARLLGFFCFPISASIYYFCSCNINTLILLGNFIVLVISTPFFIIPFKQLLSRFKVFEHFGTQSLYLYLLHGLCLYVAIQHSEQNHGMLFFGFLLGTIVLSYLFRLFSVRIQKTII